MAVKVFGASLFFSYLFLCIMSDCGYKNITEDEYNNFKGVDVTSTCGNTDSMKKMCLKIDTAIGVSHDKEDFKSGYPKCETKKIQLQKSKTPGAELVFKDVQMLVCSWPSNCNDDFYTKGQGPNHVMNYNCDPSSCLPYNDIKIQQ